MPKMFLLGLIPLLLSACVVGNTYDYRAMELDLRARSSAAVAVGVHDKRGYIVTEDKGTDFVGLQRGGFGNPFDVTTRSGAALADDLAQTIAEALRKNGIPADSVALSPQIGREAALQKLAATGAERAILVTLKEWKSDNLINVALIYTLSDEVLDKQGRVLGESRLQGRDAVGAGLGQTVIGNHVIEGSRRLMTALLDDEQIVAALASAASDSTVAETSKWPAEGSSPSRDPGSSPERDRAAQDPARTEPSTPTQDARSVVTEASDSDRERVTRFIRSNENKVKSRLASYNASKRIGRTNSPEYNIITIDHIFPRALEGNHATVELGFSSGYRSFPSYHKYLYEVRLSSGDIVILGHQKL